MYIQRCAVVSSTAVEEEYCPEVTFPIELTLVATMKPASLLALLAQLLPLRSPRLAVWRRVQLFPYCWGMRLCPSQLLLLSALDGAPRPRPSQLVLYDRVCLSLLLTNRICFTCCWPGQITSASPAAPRLCSLSCSGRFQPLQLPIVSHAIFAEFEVQQ